LPFSAELAQFELPSNSRTPWDTSIALSRPGLRAAVLNAVARAGLHVVTQRYLLEEPSNNAETSDEDFDDGLDAGALELGSFCRNGVYPDAAAATGSSASIVLTAAPHAMCMTMAVRRRIRSRSPGFKLI
jgi:hypothetical protein